MPKPLSEQVVVVTGASSGIGRETARMLGRRGASVVLAARNAAALAEAAAEVEAGGGAAHAVVTDVAEWPQVERLAREAVRRFGRIDTWVNDAAVSEYATFEDMTVDEIDRILQVNLHGALYGCKAALPVLRRQGRGTLITVGSVLSQRAIPLQSVYCATKHGLKGFIEALRVELDREKSGINVTLILPGVIGTPYYDVARSHLSVKPKPVPPVYAPSAVAEAIVFAAEHPRRDLYIGGAAKGMAVLETVSPALFDRLMLLGGAMFRTQQTAEPETPRPDNLFAPVAGAGASEGSWRGRPSLYTRLLELHPGRKRALLLAGVAAGAALWARRRD